MIDLHIEVRPSPSRRLKSYSALKISKLNFYFTYVDPMLFCLFFFSSVNFCMFSFKKSSIVMSAHCHECHLCIKLTYFRSPSDGEQSEEDEFLPQVCFTLAAFSIRAFNLEIAFRLPFPRA